MLLSVLQRVIVEGQPPAGDPAWRRFAGADDTGMYGRALDWHRQAQRQNWAAAWTRVRAPVLAVFGENDSA